MNKDVIYIDVEDDITTIISKIKASKERIIALVPPRRIGVLQSAVNIRLLARAATSADKRIVLITNDSVLAGLAATAKIPIAKTLQSKPEIAEIPVLKVDDDNDVIDGGKLAVGDMADSAKRSKKSDEDSAVDNAIADANKKESKGYGFGADVEMAGEVVFNTAMTGYQETISDPSYNGQIITFTYPLIGNYGINRDDYETISQIRHVNDN